LAGLPYLQLTPLQDGKVLAAGGTYDNITSQVYDPAIGAWAAAGGISDSRPGFTLTLLPDGRVLQVGITDTHLYDPVNQTWTPTANPHGAKILTTATLLRDGTVLVAGGDRGGSSEVFDPATQTWQLTGPMLHVPRQQHTATRLNDGTVLAAGGSYEGPPCDEATCTIYYVRSAEVFTPEAS
jgi:hypothetical protein